MTSVDRLSEKVAQLREEAAYLRDLPWEGDRRTDVVRDAQGEWVADFRSSAEPAVLAINAFPALLDHVEDVLRRHFYDGESLWDAEDREILFCACGQECSPEPCPEVESVSRLLDVLVPDPDPKAVSG